jgi:small subunit ribosomal protein S8
MMTDPIADMLTRVRNACGARKRSVDVPSSKFKVAIAEALLRERFIKDYKVVEDGKQGILRIQLKYTRSGESVIRGLRRISKPGLRRYVGVTELPRVRSNYGTAILSTPRGVLTTAESRRENTGGEIVCHVW